MFEVRNSRLGPFIHDVTNDAVVCTFYQIVNSNSFVFPLGAENARKICELMNKEAGYVG